MRKLSIGLVVVMMMLAEGCASSQARRSSSRGASVQGHNVSLATSDTRLNLRSMEYDVDEDFIVAYLEKERANAEAKSEENVAAALEFLLELAQLFFETTR